MKRELVLSVGCFVAMIMTAACEGPSMPSSVVQASTRPDGGNTKIADAQVTATATSTPTLVPTSTLTATPSPTATATPTPDHSGDFVMIGPAPCALPSTLGSLGYRHVTVAFQVNVAGGIADVSATLYPALGNALFTRSIGEFVSSGSSIFTKDVMWLEANYAADPPRFIELSAVIRGQTLTAQRCAILP